MTATEEKPATHAEAAASKFLTGRCSFQRFRVCGQSPKLFSEGHIEALEKHAAGRARIASADGIESGWSAGGHVLDTAFGFAKNIVNDCLVFDLRIDTNKPPADKLKAYTEIEVAALAKNNPSGFASRKQKRAAREAAIERLEQDAKDGRFIKHKLIPVLWDLRRGEVLFGATSLSQIDIFVSLFRDSFGLSLEAITAGRLAEAGEFPNTAKDAISANFVPGVSPDELSWCPDENSRDFLGNEFAVWLWYHTEVESDTIKLGDDSEVAVMLARTLTLECPRAATGKETIRHEMPNRLPEAKRALQSGKLPRKVGFTIVRHSEQYEFVLQAESFATGSVKMPSLSEDIVEARARQEARVDQIRDFIEAVELFYSEFLRVRCREWKETLAAIQKWMAKG